MNKLIPTIKTILHQEGHGEIRHTFSHEKHVWTSMKKDESLQEGSLCLDQGKIILQINKNS